MITLHNTGNVVYLDEFYFIGRLSVDAEIWFWTLFIASYFFCWMGITDTLSSLTLLLVIKLNQEKELKNMNKGAIIFLVAVILTTLLSTLYVNAGRDVSWIPIVEEYVKEENWLPNREYEPIAFESFFLYENGEEHFFRLDSHNEFVSYVKGLLISADRKLDYINFQR